MQKTNAFLMIDGPPGLIRNIWDEKSVDSVGLTKCTRVVEKPA